VPNDIDYPDGHVAIVPRHNRHLLERNKIMTSSLRVSFAVALSVVAMLAGAGWAFVEYCHRPRTPEYVDAPFTKAPADFPRVLPIAEWGSVKDRASQDRFRDNLTNVRKYLREDGAVRRISAEERAAYLIVLDANDQNPDGFVKARTLSGAILDSNPNSFIGHFVMAQVQQNGESNLPAALFEIRQARKLLERRGQLNPDDEDAREWYILVLFEEYEILGAMDRREEQLKVVDLLEAVYQPMPWLRIFPLIKQQKVAEAEAIIEALDKAGTHPMKVLNSRSMIDEQRRDRAGNYSTSKNMIQKIPNSAVLWSNFGLSCITDFRFGEAEAAYQKSVASHYDFYNSPHFGLSSVYLQKGQMRQAWQAVKSGQAQRGLREAHTLQQDRSVAERSAATVLLVAGKGDAAVRYARRAFERPGRVGSTTNTDADEEFSSGILLLLALESRIAELQESTTAFTAGSAWEVQTLRAEAWSLRQRLTKMLGDESFLRNLARPYLPGTGYLESWQLGSMMAFLPLGIAEETLAQARSAETHPAAAAYFDSMAAELALARGRYEESLSLAQRALDKLPDPAEKLLRGRVAAVASEAARRMGQGATSIEFARSALRDFPYAFRMLGLRIPVRVEDDGSEEARRFSTLLLASPRFRNDSEGFRIQVRHENGKAVVVMHRGEADIHVRTDAAIAQGDRQSLTDAIARIHERILSPNFEMSNVEINGIDQIARPKQ
jgi:tetratricopeptide (TPR) repeat protein